MGNYLVTGGAGFIGSNLVERLVADGHDVMIIDDLSTGDLGNLPWGIPVLKAPYEVSLPLVAEEFLLSEERNGIDGVFHLGAPSNSLLYRKDHKLVGTSIEEFLLVLEFVRKHSARLVYVSSSSIYNGNPTPWTEDMPLFPKDYYTETRYNWERMSRLYHEFYGVESIGLRLFSVYGPHEKSKGIFANLLTQLAWAAELGEEFNIYGDALHGYGNQSRDTIHVSDVVNAFMLAMAEKDIVYGIYNIGTGRGYTLNEMAVMVGAKTRQLENPIDPNYVWATLADTSKAERELGFSASVSIEDGIERLKADR